MSSSQQFDLKPPISNRQDQAQAYLKQSQLKQIDDLHRQNLQHFFDLKITTNLIRGKHNTNDLKNSVDNYLELLNHEKKIVEHHEALDYNTRFNMSEASSLIDFKNSLLNATTVENTKQAKKKTFKKIVENHETKQLNLNHKASHRIIDNTRPILPNLLAVKKSNMPIKGLACREAKTRIVNSSDDYSSLETYFLKNSNDNVLKDPISETNQENFRNNHYNKNILLNNQNNFLMPDDSSHLPSKINYKEMRRGIRKGVTINQPNQSDNYNEIINNMVNNCNSTTNGRMVSKNKNLKILKIKGDRIGAVQVVSKSAPVNRFENKNEIKNINYNIDEKYYLDITFKTRLLSSSMHSMRSMMSPQSIMPNRQSHPTPDITN